MTRKPKPFATEVDLCKAFLDALPAGWISYAETGGWDILLVRTADGCQVGIQAKLKFTAHLLNQALEYPSAWAATYEGPDFRAVMTPEGECRLGTIANYIGISTISVKAPPIGKYDKPFRPLLPGVDDDSLWRDEWHDWAPTKRIVLPAYVPDVVAGAPAPLQLSTWKVGALKITATLQLRGYVTRQDFKHLDISVSRWLSRDFEWLVARDGRLFAGPKMPDFAGQHPRVYAEVLADAEKWMLKLPALAELPAQKGLAV